MNSQCRDDGRYVTAFGVCAQSTAGAAIRGKRRRIVIASLVLPPFLASGSCYGEPLDELCGTFALIEDGRAVEYIRIERRGPRFLLSRMRAGKSVAPVPVEPVTRQKLEAIIKQPVDITFEGLGNDRLAVLKVPKGWRIASFVCSTGYLLATTLGPAELHKL